MSSLVIALLLIQIALEFYDNRRCIRSTFLAEHIIIELCFCPSNNNQIIYQSHVIYQCHCMIITGKYGIVGNN